MNKYKYKFSIKCPNNDESIKYSLVMRSKNMFMAEDIVKICNHLEGYQEYIAGVIKEKFNCEVKLTGTHSGVKVITKL